jgi:hypothetical protein
MFEVYNPDSVQLAMKQNILQGERSIGNIVKMQEFVDAKNIREYIIQTQGGKCLIENDVTMGRHGKRHRHQSDIDFQNRITSG